MGYGWFVQQPCNGKKVVWHFGLEPNAFSSLVVKVPSDGLTLILLANSDGLTAPFRRELESWRRDGLAVCQDLLLASWLAGAAIALAMSLLAWTPARAAADWYFTPFFGWDVGGSTTLVDLQYLGANRTKVTFGGSAALTIGIVGVEADYAFIPQFFQDPDPEPGSTLPPPPVLSSHVQTLTGNVLLLAPLTWTRESLRPYLVGGLGWMDASAN